MKENQLSERMLNYDILRIAAAYLVVMLHLSVQYINKTPASVDEYLVWQQSIKLSVISRTGVPLFVMLSGAFLLNPEKKIGFKEIFTKYMPKLILTFLIWSFFYSLDKQGFFTNLSQTGFSESWASIDWESFWPYFVRGHYHMWYLYMLAGLYLITPFIKYITQLASATQLAYFVFLCVLITSVTKFNDVLWKSELLDVVLSQLSLTFVFGYLGYYAAGWLIKAYTPDWKSGWRVSAAVFIAGILAFRFTYQETWALNPMFGFDNVNLIYFSNYSPTVFIMSFAVFLLAAKFKNIKLPNVLAKITALMPRYMLVVYLVHPFIIGCCRNWGLLRSADSAWSLPINALTVYAASLLISIVLVEVYRLVFRAVR